MKCLAKTLYGLEDLAAKELREMGMQNVKPLNRAVSFTTNLYGIYQANYCSRIAMSILVEIERFDCKTEDQLYEGMRAIDWHDMIDFDQTFMVRATLHASNISHSQFAALRCKDAIADRFLADHGKRPNVDTTDPDVKIQVHISKNHCTVSLDSSGDPLFKRGYRDIGGPAPINECLAAAILQMADYNGKQNFLDPMCGSGTFCIEAGMIAHNMAPGHKRRFGFQNWMNYDSRLFGNLVEKEANKITDATHQIKGLDNSNGSLKSARFNSAEALLDETIKIGKKDFFELEPQLESPSLVVFNPPYDKKMRLTDSVDFYKRMGQRLKFNFPETEIWIISSHLEALKHVGLKPSKKIKLFNGPLECRLVKYEVYKGSRK